MHGVAQIYTFFDLFKLNKTKLQIDSRNTDIIVAYICLSSCTQLALCRCRIKLIAQVYRTNLRISECPGRVNRLFRQRYDNLSIFVVPERIDPCVNISIILFLLNACQILPVADRDAAVCASVRIQYASISVVGPFTVPVINKRAGCPAHQRPDRCRFNDCQGACAGAHIRGEIKRARCRRTVGCQRVQRSLNTDCGECAVNISAQVITQMLCVDSHNSVERF